MLNAKGGSVPLRKPTLSSASKHRPLPCTVKCRRTNKAVWLSNLRTLDLFPGG